MPSCPGRSPAPGILATASLTGEPGRHRAGPPDGRGGAGGAPGLPDSPPDAQVTSCLPGVAEITPWPPPVPTAEASGSRICTAEVLGTALVSMRGVSPAGSPDPTHLGMG